jgi:hypothetical protein
MFDATFAGFLSLMGFLFGLQIVSSPAGAPVAGFAWFQVLLAVAMMFSSHFIMRTAFRRGVALTPPDVARSIGLRIVPVLTTGIVVAQLLTLRSLGDTGLGAFGWDLTRNIVLPTYALSLIWHVGTIVILTRSGPTTDAAK